ASWDGWKDFSESPWKTRIPYELKFNTGMNRLGIPFEKLDWVLRQLRTLPAGAWPSGVMTHLARGDEPTCRQSRGQLSQFIEIRSQFEAASPRSDLRYHFGNSAAIWNA